MIEERYLLRHFGYHGDLLDNVEETMGIDTTKLVKVVAKVEEMMKAQGSKKGPYLEIWIGLGWLFAQGDKIAQGRKEGSFVPD